LFEIKHSLISLITIGKLVEGLQPAGSNCGMPAKNPLTTPPPLFGDVPGFSIGLKRRTSGGRSGNTPFGVEEEEEDNDEDTKGSIVLLDEDDKDEDDVESGGSPPRGNIIITVTAGSEPLLLRVQTRKSSKNIFSSSLVALPLMLL
jgi:hypothetical protein